MGLCKCPKRQVTNQFCFEHRVNVCENCMVNSHPKCVVQSYLQWLKDSDYDSSCALCKSSLESDECVRLICYHVFHWNCLNEREAALPSNTAPGGHTCPTCYDQIFPPSNLISPIADELRSRLRHSDWGLSGLGFLMSPSESMSKIHENNRPMHDNFITRNTNETGKSSNEAVAAIQNKTNQEISRDYSVFSIDPNPSNFQASSRKPLLSRDTPIGMDHDDNKYKRRAPAEIFSRWSRRFYVSSSRPIWRRTWFTALFGIGFFVFFIYLISSLRSGDPFNESNIPDEDIRAEFPHM